tara:strand:+ start:353 stop:1969 length:1617 start_codon:yes stop_codon:yes gene_type:complete
MNWIGQHIVAFIARFRSTVYLESLSDPATDTDKFLVAGSDGKVGYRTGDQILNDIGAGSGTLDDTSLVVVKVTSLQAFAEGVDHAILKDRGTGVASSYTISVISGGTTFTVSEVHGEINSDEGFAHITYGGASGITVSDLTASSTYVYVDKNSALQQQTSLPTRQDWSRKMFLMRISVSPSTATINAFEYLNNPSGHYTNSMRDIYSYLLAQGVPFKKDQLITGRTTDLGFDVSAGSLLEFGGTGDINNANIKIFDAVSHVEFYLATRTTQDGGGNTDLPKFWDNKGTLTALGSTTWVAHRLYRFSSGNFVLQYGQGNYANLTLAKAGSVIEDYELKPSLKNSTFFGWWFIESTATNTGNTAATQTTEFVEYTLGIQGGVSGALGGCLLKGNNLSDLTDVNAANANLGTYSLLNRIAIKILPSDFIADDGGTTVQIDDSRSGERFLKSGSVNPLFASIEIPKGYKATDIIIYGNGTSAVTVYEASINDKAVTSKGTGNIGTPINITDVTNSSTNYLLIELAQASGEQVNGGLVTIEKV